MRTSIWLTTILAGWVAAPAWAQSEPGAPAGRPGAVRGAERASPGAPVAAGPAAAEAPVTAASLRPRHIPPATQAPPVRVDEAKPRALDQPLSLRVVEVVDGRVLAGQQLPRSAIDTLAKLGYARVPAGGVRPDSIHEDRLYRSYLFPAGSKAKAEDFQALVGREVQVKVVEILPGRVYGITEIVGR